MIQRSAQAMFTLSDEQLQQLLHELQQRTGITVETPRWLLEEYLGERSAELGMSSVQDYLDSLKDDLGSRAEWLALVDLLTVKETRFFRQPAAFQQVRQEVCTRAQADTIGPEFSVWSVGCSTGEELYSLGMVVEHALRDSGCATNWHGIGTDVSFGAVARAKIGRYPERSINDIPLAYRSRYIRCEDKDQYWVCDRIFNRISFFHSNLMHVENAPFAKFDIVFCQNVLIYFDRETRLHIIDQLLTRTRAGGLLVLGAGEDIGWHTDQAERISQDGVTTYRKLGGFENG